MTMKLSTFLSKRNPKAILAMVTAMIFTMIDVQAIGQHIARLTRYEVKPASQEDFRKAMSAHVVSSLKNPSNILSEAYHEEADTSVLWLIERWSSREALDRSDKERLYKSIDALAANALKQPVKKIFVKDLEPLSKQQWRTVAGKEDQPITIMLFVDAKPGTEPVFKKIYHTAMPAFRSEPGVINYQLSQLEEDSTQFVTYEKFRSEKGFQ
ncbi:MAG: hypothetical protein EOO00_05895, partial [Chitinophagaceae bacterium]